MSRQVVHFLLPFAKVFLVAWKFTYLFIYLSLIAVEGGKVSNCWAPLSCSVHALAGDINSQNENLDMETSPSGNSWSLYEVQSLEVP